MTVWFTSLTIFNRRYSLRLAVILALCVALTTTLLFGIISQISHAAPGVNQTISFQGRLLDASGNVVPDGHYNMQFKIYEGGTGVAANDPDGTLKWTETYINNGGSAGVEIKNGFLSVDLGEENPFGTSIDWNQDNLWLSMNVAGSSASCTEFGTAPCVADGEMLPMKQLTASPYAINSSMLDGISSSGFLQNTTTPQTADFNITGSGTADLLQGTTKVVTPAIDTINEGDTLTIGAVDAATINIGRANGATSNINIAGNTTINLPTDAAFTVKDSSDNSILTVQNNNEIHTGTASTFIADGNADFTQGITIQGTGGLSYTTPGGLSIHTAINIPNYTVPANSSIFAFGLPSTSDATARGLVVADARTTDHAATIGVLSPDENSTMGLSWNGSNSTGTLSNTANSLALQGNGLNLLTATNNGGSANIGIGNSATSGYALDVTGDINSSDQYRINGVTALTGSALTFADANTATVNSATGQSLDLNGSTGVAVKVNGATSATFNENGVQIGSGTGTGTPSVLTLDKSGSAPLATGDAMLGSMYYDTTLGEVQCYEASGWGNCTASPDNFITLSPEYSNAVMHGTDTGTMTSDLCSDALNVNDGSSSQPTICGTDETYNYYDWTSSAATAHNRSIYVTYQLPGTFKGFVPGSTSLMGRTDSADSSVSYEVYRNSSTGLTACGTSVAVSTGAQSTWQKGTAADTADPSTCDFEAGDSIVFKIDLTSANDANAYASTLGFAFTNH